MRGRLQPSTWSIFAAMTIEPDEPKKMTKSPTLTKSPPFTVLVKKWKFFKAPSRPCTHVLISSKCFFELFTSKFSFHKQFHIHLRVFPLWNCGIWAFGDISQHYGSKNRISIWITTVSECDKNPPTHPERIDFVWLLSLLKNGRKMGEKRKSGYLWRHM